MKCKLFNARSLRNKLDNLQLLLTAAEYDVIFVTETWLREDIPDALLVQGSNYSVHRCDRIGLGGGVAVFIKSSLKAVPVTLPEIAEGAEFVCLDVFLGGGIGFRFLAVYFPPAATTNRLATDNLCSVLDCAARTNKAIVVVGDFNFPKIDWEIPVSYGNACTDDFLDCCNRNNLKQIVKNPTRDGNILDIVLCSEPSSVRCLEIAPRFAASCDHESVDFSLNRPTAARQLPKSVPNFRKADTAAILRHLSGVNWVALEKSCKLPDGNPDVQAFSAKVASELDHCVEEFVPKVKVKPRVPRYPRNIRRLESHKRALHKGSIGDASLKPAYRQACRLYDEAVSEYYTERERILVEENNLNAFYKYVNSKTKSRSSVPPLLTDDGTYATEDLDKASLLNSYFGSVFTSDNEITPKFAARVQENAGLHSVQFSYENVVKVLRNLPNKTSRSPDGFPALLLKSVAKEIAVPLCRLFEMSMRMGVLPESWKVALITPVFKKGISSLRQNYRPISLTCVMCKVAERIVADRLVAYLRANNLITPEQYGFLSRRSTCTQLLAMLNKWTKAVNNKCRVDSVYIDFSKAFDSVCHSKLLVKLKAYGVDYELLNWLRAFLSGRTQSVCVGEAVSSSVSVRSGVPQGSVLGPILFLVYINDIVDCVEGACGIKLFADDGKFYLARNGGDASDLVKTLERFVKWSSEWQLTVANDKCCVLSVGNQSVPDCQFVLSDTPLVSVSQVRDLGVLLSSDLKSSSHCAAVAKKAYSRASLILRCFKSRNPFLLVRAYKVYVRPLLESCTSVWNPYLKRDIECIEKVQRFFTRVLFSHCGLGYREYDARLRFLYLEPLELRRLKSDLCITFQIVRGLVDLSFADFFQYDRSPYALRGHDYKLKLAERYNLNCRKHFFSQRVIPVWNSLSARVVSSNSLMTFKKWLDLSDVKRFCTVF